MTKLPPNPFKGMSPLVRLWMRAKCPTLYQASDGLWRDGWMYKAGDESAPDEEAQALLMQVMQVTQEAQALAAQAAERGIKDGAVLTVAVLGAYMAGWNLARELARPLVWQEAEDA